MKYYINCSECGVQLKVTKIIQEIFLKEQEKGIPVVCYDCAASKSKKGKSE